MSFVAAAIVGAGVVGAGASIYGANKAADAQTNAANQATQAQLGMFNTAKDQLQPFIDTGKNTLPQLTAWNDSSNPNSPISQLLKLVTPGPDQNAALAQTPGYQFSLQQGQKAVTSGLAARGLAGPGGALAKGGANFAEGLAGNTWQSVVNALLGTYQGGGNALQNIANTGAGSAGTLTGAATQTGGQIGSNMIGAGNAQAGAAIGTANAIGSGANSVSSATLLSQLLNKNGVSPQQQGLYDQTSLGYYPSSAPYNN